MSSLIKCPKCQTWNENLDYCSNCHQLLNYAIQKQQEDSQKQLEALQKPKDRMELYLERIKNSDKAIDKMIYLSLKSTWFLLVAFVSLALAVLVFGPG